MNSTGVTAKFQPKKVLIPSKNFANFRENLNSTDLEDKNVKIIDHVVSLAERGH